jgi:hypothetical protein
VVELDATGWSGDGTFTELLIAALREIDAIERVRVEDAPASRADAGFSFISNEVFVTFRRGGVLFNRQPRMTLKELELHLTSLDTVGEPDYADEGMLQYLRTERIRHAYQTRPYKLVELVRVYEAAKGGNGPGRNPGGSVS